MVLSGIALAGHAKYYECHVFRALNCGGKTLPILLDLQQDLIRMLQHAINFLILDLDL